MVSELSTSRVIVFPSSEEEVTVEELELAANSMLLLNKANNLSRILDSPEVLMTMLSRLPTIGSLRKRDRSKFFSQEIGFGSTVSGSYFHDIFECNKA
ncbi:hypothetical protein IFM89_033865 [Coptis chinensis]|uniref:Uncharacterized protein n=1 Tax=Coptis chinensis TaxID=261450 RepID=A0A835GZK8_9MAGN|nr:hypothetical protein IFM89_033865 [Coptis chinensis]